VFVLEYNVLYLLLEERVQVIDITWKAVFDHNSKHREQSWKYDAQRSIFDELRGVWKFGQTRSWVFDICSQSKLKWRRNRRIKIVKFFANQDQISKHRQGHDFLCFKLDELLMSLRMALTVFPIIPWTPEKISGMLIVSQPISLW